MSPTPILEIAQNNLGIMADFGLTCSGDLKRALLLIEVAAEIGVNAVKFQGLDPNQLLGDKSIMYTYPTYTGEKITENMFEMFSALTFTYDEWHKIKNHCLALNIDLVVTCHVESMVPIINSLDLSCNKICTWSLNHYRMISQLAANGKPLILDSGTLDINQLNDLRDFYIASGGSSVYVLFDFHTNDSFQMNMSAMNQLADNNYLYGYTPQGRDNHLDFLALGLGASILEKRLTLSRTTQKNGHWKALEPSEFYDWLQLVKHCHQALGSNILTASDADLNDSLKYYKSAYLACDVLKGDVIKSEDFVFLRPGTGVSSKSVINNYIGKHYSRDFSVGDMFCD